MKKSFSRFQKLLCREEFRTLYREGSRWNGRSLLFFYLSTLSPSAKLGITIAKKWGKAHDRNRFKRIVREGFRKSYPLIPKGLILNVHPRDGYQALTSKEVELEFKQFTAICVAAQSQSTKSRCHN